MSQDDAADGGKDAESSQFIPDPEELRRVAGEVAAQFPPPRLGTELVLLEVDPRRAHAYWNIDPVDQEAAAAVAGPGAHPLVLRMCDVTPGAAGSAFDVEVQGLQNHWYIDLWEPGRAYVAEIGLRLPDGALASIARSNRVETPRAAQAESAEVTLLDIGAPEADADPVGPAVAAVREVATSAVPQMAVLPPPPAPGPILQDRYPETSALAAEPLAAAPATAEPALPPPAGPARPAVPPIEVGPWPTAEELLRHVPETGVLSPPAEPRPAAPRLEAAAPAAATPSATEAPRPPATGAPAPAVTDPPAAPLEQYVNLSSFVNGRPQVDLEVNVELHIYGRARPGAHLTFGGQRVVLRPDGTFSLRKPLPQGAVVLPLVLHPEPPAGAGA